MLRDGCGDLRGVFRGFTVPHSSRPSVVLAVHAIGSVSRATGGHHLLPIVVLFAALLRDSCGRRPTSQG